MISAREDHAEVGRGNVLHWALEGRGIVVRSQWEIEGHPASGELVPLLSDWASPDSNIHAIYLERNQLSAMFRTFVGFLGEYLRRPQTSASVLSGGDLGFGVR